MKSLNIHGLTLWLACASSTAFAQDLWLVNPDEAVKFEGEAGFMAPPGLRARPVMPLIAILQAEAVPDS